MRKFILLALTICSASAVLGQGLAPQPASSPVSTPGSAADVEALRQQVQSLTETVKALQQQVKDQQATIERSSQSGSPAPENGGTPSVASTSESSSNQSDSHPTRFPTEDESVVASTSKPATKTKAGVTADGTTTAGFPTTDTSVVSSSTNDVSVVAGGSS